MSCLGSVLRGIYVKTIVLKCQYIKISESQKNLHILEYLIMYLKKWKTLTVLNCQFNVFQYNQWMQNQYISTP